MPLHASSLQQYQNIDENQSQQKVSSTSLVILKQLKSLQYQISNKIIQYQQVTTNYKSKLEKDFILTFTKIMQRVGNDLVKAQQAYNNIDQEVMKNNKCQILDKNLHFFKHQCIYYKQQLDHKDAYIIKLKQTNMILLKQNQAFKDAIFHKVKETIFYKEKYRKTDKQLTAIKNQLKQTQNHQKQAQNYKKQVQNHQKQTQNPENKLVKISIQKNKKRKQSIEQIRKMNNSLDGKIALQKNALFKNIRKQLKQRQLYNFSSMASRQLKQQEKSLRKKPQSSLKHRRHQSSIENSSLTPRFTKYNSTRLQPSREEQFEEGQSNSVNLKNDQMFKETFESSFYQRNK